MSDFRTKFLTVGIDGGAATGKSSTSRRVAAIYKLLHVDTGSHYRALAAGLIAAGVSPESQEAIESYTQKLALDTVIESGSAHIVVDGVRPADEDLRSDAVNANVSKFAAVPAVREALRDYQRSQRELAHQKAFDGLIVEGRDIGSVIFPDADLLFFLEADEATRAKRRAAEGQQDAVAERDKMDATRKTAPLTCPQNAERIDTGSNSLEEVVALIGSRIDAKRIKV
ncbi:(d)CMP kinase [Rubellicoccus peritrichatus]|uniref:Cytidylate kinase n=1 Tax=Rubellicoccus peritrichatus TaxID=3080537 RepID=A0AAQ3L580_9BACT|nr:(d)CMP kinase [Puniceicoccus sp. CR14]WOO39629.1 (d)CMP kinase [Puniceicoccus sp. CR14]